MGAAFRANVSFRSFLSIFSAVCSQFSSGLAQQVEFRQ